MKKIILSFLLFGAIISVHGQNSGSTRIWVLDSVAICEISDNIEIPVKYNDIKNSIHCVFDTIALGPDHHCKLTRGKEQWVASHTTLTDSFTIHYEQEDIIYQYDFDGNWYLKRIFPGRNVQGEDIEYRLFMRFKTNY